MTFTQAIENYLKRTNQDTIRLKAMLFDMDGVLFDSMKNHTKSWHQTMMEEGIPCTEEEFYF